MSAKGCVYVMSTNKVGVFKIGYSIDPNWRAWELSGIGAKLIYCSPPHSRARQIEARAHALMLTRRIRGGSSRELFRCSQEEAIAAVESALADDAAMAPPPERKNFTVSLRVDRETFMLIDDLRRVYKTDRGATSIPSTTEVIMRAVREAAERMTNEIAHEHKKSGVRQRD